MHLRDGLQPHESVRTRYDHLVKTGRIDADAAQAPLVAALDRVLTDIASRRQSQKSSALGWLFAKKRGRASDIKGLYVHGGVGIGKSMLMDMFFDLVPVDRKRRVHFNAFMADVQDRIGRHRQARKDGKVKEDDPIPPVARDLAADAWVLCFDEFSVTDIADAMILSRLFAALFDAGVVLVATSNVAPDDLYRDGLNRQLFLPLVALLESHVEVLALRSETDHRLLKLKSQPVYLTPDDEAAQRAMNAAWAQEVAGHGEARASIAVKGREIPVLRAAGRAARFGFAELCERPLAARDYLAIVERFDTLFVDHIPLLAEGLRNEAKRFILLIDTLYEAEARLVASAAAAPQNLYAGRTGNEAFEFDRTASRLIEMQSGEWLERWAARRRGRAGYP